MSINRILFDTNIWNYFADYGYVYDLKRAARAGAKRIVVAPSTLYEALRINNPETRARRAKFITDLAWKRLMPEAYSESQELLMEIKRLRPQWLKSKQNRGIVQRFRHDWGRTKDGFWARARRSPDREAGYITQWGDEHLEAARKHADAQRKIFRESTFEPTVPLTDVVAIPLDRPAGYEGDKIEAWRFTGWTSTDHALKTAGHPYLDWLSADVDFKALFRDEASWLRFWLYEIELSRMPRFWLRWAFEHLQLFHKVTAGTPGDVQLATYLLEADVVVSADKNFLRITDAVRPYAQFPLAKTKLVTAELRGVIETLEFVQRS
jgi:hypothetical protein